MLMVIFVVLMILALFGGGWGAYEGDTFKPHRFGSFFLLWLCVAILGWVVFNGPGPPVRVDDRRGVVQER